MTRSPRVISSGTDRALAEAQLKIMTGCGDDFDRACGGAGTTRPPSRPAEMSHLRRCERWQNVRPLCRGHPSRGNRDRGSCHGKQCYFNFRACRLLCCVVACADIGLNGSPVLSQLFALRMTASGPLADGSFRTLSRPTFGVRVGGGMPKGRDLAAAG